MKLTAKIARNLILAAQYTPMRGVGGYSPEAFTTRGERHDFPQASREAATFDEFFSLFPPGLELRDALTGRDVLDFGSGYGGRTVEYALQCKPRFVWGVEPVERHVDLGNAYARSRGVGNCRFLLCTQTETPLSDESVDVVVSFDVIEHVAHPLTSLREIRRVLRPGGKAILAFPVYDGAFSHHLDYVGRLPGIHWLFSATTLIEAVNSILHEDKDMRRFGTPSQPVPGRSFDGARLVLPMLNGLDGDGFLQLLDGFTVEVLHFRPLLARHPLLGWPTRTLMRLGVKGRVRDSITRSIACVLRKDP